MLIKVMVWCRAVDMSSPERTLTARHHMSLLPDMLIFLRMRRECRERFPRCRLQRKPRVSDPSITARASRTCRDACRDR